jgi:hypothetical protein
MRQVADLRVVHATRKSDNTDGVSPCIDGLCRSNGVVVEIAAGGD